MALLRQILTGILLIVGIVIALASSHEPLAISFIIITLSLFFYADSRHEQRNAALIDAITKNTRKLQPAPPAPKITMPVRMSRTDRDSEIAAQISEADLRAFQRQREDKT